MHENLQELTNTPRRDVRIDRDSGILSGVKIIGCRSRNGREYPNETLREAIPLYENAKVNLDHPEGDPRKPRSYQDRFGVIRNVQLRENEGLFAEFRFNPKHAVAEQLLWDAEYAPENVGFSHNVEAVVRREQDKVVVEKIVSVRSVDLVADPATTSGLFESFQEKTTSATQDSFETKKENPHATKSSGEMEPESRSLSGLTESLLKGFRNLVPGSSRLFDDSFLGILSSIADQELQRRLVEDRMRLVEQVGLPPEEVKPVCREQFVPERPIDFNSFLQSIRR